MRNGKVHAENNSEALLAVGSAFQLYVPDQVAERARSGDLSWQDKVTLEQRHISYPGGTMQNEPIGRKFVLPDVAHNTWNAEQELGVTYLIALVVTRLESPASVQATLR